MSTIPDAERLLPPPEELELAEYLLAGYLSKLDWIASRLRRETVWEAVTLEEFERLEQAGALDVLDGPGFDRGELLELLRFADDAIDDAEHIREEAARMRSSILAQLHENNLTPAALRACRSRVRRYYEQQLAAYSEGGEG